MNRLFFIVLFLLQGIAALPQNEVWTAEQLQSDSIRLAALPKLVLKNRLKSGFLPVKVDNSTSTYFPPLFTQFGWSCNQCSSIAYLFTYELNVLRRKQASMPENRMSLLFPWNMLNSGSSTTGVSYFDSWDLVDGAGCASVKDFGHGTGNSNEECTNWMSGYPNYYRAMQNRIEGTYALDIGTEEGLQTLKGWFFNHGVGRSPGGVASFQIASSGIESVQLPLGTEDAGKTLITRFASQVGHSMTFVGYNDNVCYDFNGDGQYTNDIDTNGDGKVTMLDWEEGALICVNSFKEFYDAGKAYVAYRLLPKNHNNGGIWMRSILAVRAYETYQPRLGLRVKLSHPSRSKLRITAGVAQDPGASKPDHVLDIPVFKYQGGGLPMQGTGTAGANIIEIGIDVSPLLDFVEPGREASFFLVINEKDPDNSSDGLLDQFAFLDYTNSAHGYPYPKSQITIVNGYQDFKIKFTPHHNPPTITNTALPGAIAGEAYQVKLEATGGTPPYKWLPIDRTYQEEVFTDTFPSITEKRLLPVSSGSNDKVLANLGFSFPLYEKQFSRMTIYTSGYLMFEANNLTYPYAIDKIKLLGLNRAIFPWCNEELSLPKNDDWIYFQTDSSKATIRWNASIMEGSRSRDVNFATRLYPSGVIEFYYGNIEMRPTFNWFAAIAGGRADHYIYPEINYTGVSNGLNIRFTPSDYPDGFTLSEDGLLTGIPSKPGKSVTFKVWVEDCNRLRGFREFTLTTASLGTSTPESAKPAVIVYPNPVTDQLCIHLLNAQPGTVILELMDLTGRKLLRKEFLATGGDQFLRCNEIGNLPQGIYIYRLSGIAEGSGRLVR